LALSTTSPRTTLNPFPLQDEIKLPVQDTLLHPSIFTPAMLSLLSPTFITLFPTILTFSHVYTDIPSSPTSVTKLLEMLTSRTKTNLIPLPSLGLFANVATLLFTTLLDITTFSIPGYKRVHHQMLRGCHLYHFEDHHQ